MTATPEHFSNLKPDPIDCPCGNAECKGQPRKKRMRDGSYHVSRCQCSRCEAGRYGKRAASRERRIAKDIGGSRSPGSGVWNGADVTGVCDVEETSNQAITRGIRRWWESKAVQAKTARLLARYSESKALVLTWDRRKRLVVMPYESWRALCQRAGADPGEDAA